MSQPTRPDRPQAPTAVERPNKTPHLDDARRTATMPGASEQPLPAGSIDPLIGVAVGEGYEIRSLIAEGGMGALYAAAHRDAPAKRKAIKVLLPSLLAKCSPRTRDDIWHRFETEAKIALRLDHPNVIVVDGYDRLPEGAIYIKMELLEGKHLGHWARDRHGGIVPADDVLRVMAQVCGALEQAHKIGVVHRDLKPANIFVVATDDGSIKTKVLDFGIARVIDPHALPGGKKTTIPRAMGTPGYWAPEQQTSPGEVDHRADIYAIGVIIFELTTGQELGFGSLAPQQLPPTFPRDWYDGVAAALATDPRQRPPNIRDLLNFLIDHTANGATIAHEACPSLYKLQAAPSESTTRAPLSGLGSVQPHATPPPPLPPSTLTHAAGAYGTQVPRRGRSLVFAALGGAAVAAVVAIGVVASLNGSSSTNAPTAAPASSPPSAAATPAAPPVTEPPPTLAPPAANATDSPPPSSPATTPTPPATAATTTTTPATTEPAASSGSSTADAGITSTTRPTRPATKRTTKPKPPAATTPPRKRTTVERLDD